MYIIWVDKWADCGSQCTIPSATVDVIHLALVLSLNPSHRVETVGAQSVFNQKRRLAEGLEVHSQEKRDSSEMRKKREPCFWH